MSELEWRAVAPHEYTRELEEAITRAEQEKSRAEQEKARADRLVERLRQLGEDVGEY